MPGQHCCDAPEGAGGDGFKGFMGEEGLMAGNQDVGIVEQRGEGVVLQGAGAEDFEEDAFFLSVDIHASDGDEGLGFSRDWTHIFSQAAVVEF